MCVCVYSIFQVGMTKNAVFKCILLFKFTL